MKRLGIALIVLALIPAAASAQGRRGGGGSRGGGAAVVVWNANATLLLFRALMDLSDSQRDQLASAFDEASRAATPLTAARNAGQKALFEAAKTGQSDAEIQRLAVRQGELDAQLQALQARTFAKMWNLLTPEQRAQVDDSTYEHIGEFLANTGGR
jgi:Spy/CpxP family protein refolding chaperone